MRHILIFILLAALPTAFGQSQTGTASIAGKVLDAKTGKAVSAAWVIANRALPLGLAEHERRFARRELYL